ncbi:SdpI family protein [Patescibacteria group bacterium]|nr:SdpI family protein [Patescibacteria group bacterium]MBU1933928.1 SdpI family protein [Patescibacteria group bacterium]MBU2233332.1 SdpI family protein [Patescibacteria group bacterium]MBU2264489.1 SdpI family protein [Patescibacteria group bacterium]
MKRSKIIIAGIILFSFIVGIYLYPQMPEKIASHWNSQGQVDGYMSKFWGLFLMPLIFVGLTLLFIAIPRIDPLKANIEKFRKYYDGFIILFFVFILSIHFWIILWNLGIEISPNVILPIGLGLLFFSFGILCQNTKRNWFIGIRTPWTLSNDVVWDKTHKIGGRLFKIAGVIAFVGVFFQSYAVFFIFVPGILAAVYTIIYSFFEYQKVVK